MQSIAAGVEVDRVRRVGKDGLAREGRAVLLMHPYTASIYCIRPMPILSRPAIPLTDRWPVVSRTPSAQVLSLGPNGIQGRSGYFTLESDVARWPQLAGASPGADVRAVSPVTVQM